LCLTTSLKLLPVAWVNAINVSQVALAALMGILFFAEPSSLWLWIGLGVMIVGFVILTMRGSRKGALA
jgi:DME family drug/metabolite transporter